MVAIRNLDWAGISAFLAAVAGLATPYFAYSRGKFKDKMDAKEAEQESQQQTYKQIIESYQKQIDSQRQTNHDFQEQIRALQRDNKYIRNELNNLQTENVKVTAENQALLNLNSQLKQDNSSLTAENQHLAVQVTTYQTKYGDI